MQAVDIDDVLMIKNCGAGTEGDPGFQEGNTCAGDGGGRIAGGGAESSVPAQHFATMPTGKATSKEAKKWRKSMQETYENDPEFRGLADTVALYTQGDYKVQRAFAHRAVTGELEERWHDSALPGWVDKGISGSPLAEYKSYFTGQDFNVATRDSRVTYTEAGRMLTNAIDQSPPVEGALYRGVTGRHFVAAAAALKPGDDFDITGTASFTFDKDIGEEFAAGTAKGQRNKKVAPYRTLIEVESGAKAMNVSAISPWDQKEYLTQGKFEVVQVEVMEESRYTKKPEVVRMVIRQKETWKAKQPAEAKGYSPPQEESELVKEAVERDTPMPDAEPDDGT